MSIQNPRVRFYLEHRQQIEAWADLRSEAAQAIDEWLLSLEDAFRQLAGALGPDVMVVAVAEGPYPAIRMFRKAWPGSDRQDPSVCVSLEWPRGKVRFMGNAHPYVGVRCPPPRQPWGTALLAERPKGKFSSTAYWVAYRYEEPAVEFHLDPEVYQRQLLNAVKAIWDEFAPAVDRCLSTSERLS